MAAGGEGGPDITEPSDGEGNPKLILNELLCYMQYHMKRTTHVNITEVIASHFSLEEVIQARDILIGNYDDKIGHLLKNRRNTQNKVKCVSMTEDIMNALQELDMKSIETHFVAKNLSRLPKCDPKDIDPYATMQLLLAIDDRLKKVEDNMGEAMAKVIYQDDGLKSLKDTVETHELLLSTRMLPSDPTYKDMTDSLDDGHAVSWNDHQSSTKGGQITGNCDNSDQQQVMKRNESHESENSNGETSDEERDTESGNDPWIQVGKNGRPVPRRNDVREQRPRVRTSNVWGQRDQRKRISSSGHQPPQGRVPLGPRRSGPQQQMKRQKYRVHGSHRSEVLEGAPPPRRDFFLSRVKKDTDDEIVKQYIVSKGISVSELVTVSNVNAKYKSFRLSVCIDDKDKVMSPDIWPQGICIEKWRSRANNKESVTNKDNGRD